MGKKKKRYRWPTTVIRQAKKMFGIKLTREDFNGLARQIRNGETLLVDRMSKNITLHIVMLPGTGVKQAKVIYSFKKSRVSAFIDSGDF